MVNSIRLLYLQAFTKCRAGASLPVGEIYHTFITLAVFQQEETKANCTDPIEAIRR